MPRPLAPGLREQIAAACRQPDAMRNQIARHFGVAPATVTTIAESIGVSFDWHGQRRQRLAEQLDRLDQEAAS